MKTEWPIDFFALFLDGVLEMQISVQTNDHLSRTKDPQSFVKKLVDHCQKNTIDQFYAFWED